MSDRRRTDDRTRRQGGAPDGDGQPDDDARPDDGRQGADAPAGDGRPAADAPPGDDASPSDQAGRAALIEHLRADGASAEEIQEAIGGRRLALLPVQRVLQGEPTLRTADLVTRSGVGPELLERAMLAAGLALPEHGRAAWEERDLALPTLLRTLSDLGVDDDAIVELTRAVGESAARIGAATIIGIGSGLTREGDTEHDIGLRFAEGTRALNDHLAEAVGLLIRAQTLDQLTAVEIADDEIADGRIAGAAPVTIGFADVVGFTRMGEQLGATRLHEVAARLGELGSEVAVGGVRVVKTIGDAVMLSGPRPGPVVASMLALQERVAAEEFPRIRAGVATGDAVPRAGDWFGPPVNRAARACAAARPESVLVDDDTRSRTLDEDLEWTTIGRIHLKGMGRVRLHRVRRPER